MTDEERGGKFMFTEDNVTRVRNIDSLLIQFPDGRCFEFAPFSGWAVFTTGTQKMRPLELIMSSKDGERLAKSYFQGQLSWTKTTKYVGALILIGWLLRSFVAALAEF